MKVERREGTRERAVLTAMVVSGPVLAQVAARWDGQLFSSPWANLVAGWCVDHHRQYGVPPGKAITSIYAAWEESSDDRDSSRLVDRFLASLSEEYESAQDINPAHVLDLAGQYFNRVRLSRLADQLQGDLDTGQEDRALERLQGFARVQLGVGARLAPFNAPSDLLDVFEGHASEQVVTYPGALGRFFQGALERDSFIAFLGPEKSGKSLHLLDVAYRAMTQRRKVAYFEVGDMSERQVKRRLYSRAAMHPFRSPDGNWPCTLRMPTRVERPEEGLCPARVEFREKTYDHPLGQREAKLACERLAKFQVRSRTPHLYLSVHPNSSLTVAGIKSTLEGWALEDGWSPDVVICDYADILAPPPGVRETRDQINTTWKQLRALSQELHCLVVTATQSDAAAYDKVILSRQNFSEDHRKLAHVTGLVGINVTHAEKDLGLRRLNWLVLREGEFSSLRCVHTAGCLALASPCMKSVM
jgi:hypothetical protein